MVRNKEKYEQAVALRKRGFTLEEIAKYCDVAKSTVSKWLTQKAFSAQVTKQNLRRAGAENAKRLRLVNKARSGERVARYREAIRSAETEYRHYKKDLLFIAGLMLYMSEGDSTDDRLIRLATVRVEVHRIFIKFALAYLGVEKKQIKFWILLYQGQNEAQCMKKWQRVTTLPYGQFYKNQFVPRSNNKQTLHFGVGNTIIGSTVLKQKLQRWIALATKELSK